MDKCGKWKLSSARKQLKIKDVKILKKALELADDDERHTNDCANTACLLKLWLIF